VASGLQQPGAVIARRVGTLWGLALATAALALGSAESQGVMPPIVSGRAPQPVSDRFVLEPPGTRVTAWVRGLQSPWSLVFLPDGRALVSERGGRIRLIEDGQLHPAAVAELRVAQGIEGGLLGLALHPRFPEEPFVYAMTTVEARGELVNRVVRLRLQGRRARLDRIVLDGIPGGQRHNGGRIAFGPDGMLYVTTGDTADFGRAQDRTSLAGKILRVTPDGRPAPGNPWSSPVYSLGHRNPQGLAWHPVTGELFASEHGPTGEGGVVAHDEINVVRAGGNYGWPLVAGAPGRPGLIDPVIAWTTLGAPPSGMTFWRGDLFVATLGSEALVRATIEATRHGHHVTSIERWFNDGGSHIGRYSRLRDAVVGPDDALYVLTNHLDAGGDPRDGHDRILRIDVGF
jgi:glucose/arabinose dehydrogenase